MNDTTDAANNEMYCAIGRATTAWQKIEDSLCDLFGRIVICSIAGSMLSTPPKSYFLMGSIFYSFTNLRARLKMIDNLIEDTVTDDDLRSEWNAIQNKILRIYPRRNTLAHSHVWGNETRGLTHISPSLYVKNAKEMNLAQILAAERSFQKTADRTTALAIAVNKHLVPLTS